MGNDTDAALIAQSQVDPERFGEIYDRYVAEVHRYLARRIGSEIADDLAAETFLVAFGSRHRYDPTAERALPWLYGIATNLLHRHRRTERAQYRCWSRTGADPTVGDNPTDTVVNRVAAEGTTRRLGAALARLTTRERDVVLLVVWGSLTYDETATALGVPVGTVRSRLNRARQRLRTELDYPNPMEDLT
jgi:RNA polymerase sigma-70 factor (ECF subfamily)